MQKDAGFNVNSFDLNKAITFSRFFTKLKLTIAAKLTLRCLIDFWNSENGYVYPKQTTLAECTGLSVVSVSNAVDELKEKKLVFTVKDGARLNYYFMEQLFVLTGTDKAGLSTTQKFFKPGHKAALSPSTNKQIIKTNNKQDNFNFKNLEKLYYQPNTYLNNRELAEIILHDFHPYNIRGEYDLNLIFLIKYFWKLNTKDFNILQYLSKLEKTEDKIQVTSKNAERTVKALRQIIQSPKGKTFD